MRIKKVKESNYYNGKKFTAEHDGKKVYFGYEHGCFFAQYEHEYAPPEPIKGRLKQRLKKIAERRI